MQQMYLIACVLGAGLQATLLTQAPSILALMGAGPSTPLFPNASAYLKVTLARVCRVCDFSPPTAYPRVSRYILRTFAGLERSVA